MKHTAWIGPWDIAEPERLLDELQEHGMDGARLAVAYHAVRLLLPRPRPRVWEAAGSALYFPASAATYGRLEPEIAGNVLPFLEAAQRRRFPVRAWTVLCHNDTLPSRHPDCAITNAWGERYSHALCPAQPDVIRYAAALARDLSQLPINGVDLEALSFLGYDHQGAHDKRGVATVPRSLSICCCGACDQWRPLARRDDALTPEYLGYRNQALCVLLEAFREALNGKEIDLRWTSDPQHFGGKAQIAVESLTGRADAVTLTFFGQPITATPDLPVPKRIGAVFHWPDCPDTASFAPRYDQLRQPGVEEIAFYLWGLAPVEQLRSLKETLRPR